MSSDSADCACMNDLARRDRTHVGRIEGHDGNGIARERRKLNLITCTLLMHQHDRADAASRSLGKSRLKTTRSSSSIMG